MVLKSILIYCMLQSVGMIVILLQKRFRTLPNIILTYLLTELLIYTSYEYLIFYLPLVELGEPFVLAIEFTTAPVIALYTYIIIFGKLPPKSKVLPHSVLPLLILITKYNVNNDLNVLINIALSINYIFYSILSIYIIINNSQIKVVKWLCVFNFKHDNTRFTYYIIICCFLTGLILIGYEISKLYVPSFLYYIEVGNIVLVVLIVYLFAYSAICYPKIVHNSCKKYWVLEDHKYANSKMNKEMASTIISKVTRIVTKSQLFLNPSVSIVMVSVKSNIGVKRITEALNRYYNQNFNEFINNKRIEYCISMMKDEKYHSYSIKFLALESGFASKTVFYNAFKRYASMTPAQYRDKLVKSNKQS